MIAYGNVPPLLDRGFKRCATCGCAVPQSHVPNSTDCQEASDDRLDSIQN